MTTRTHAVVIGGGIAGLVAAVRIAQRGVPVTLVEKASRLGGRAATRQHDGFLFNLGPHALYRRGRLHAVLQELGVPIEGALPPTGGGYALHGGRRHTLPVGFVSLVGTGLLTLPGKFELARLLTRLPGLDAAASRRQTLASWLDTNIGDRRARAVLEMLVRVATFTHDPARQSAGAALEQLQLAVAGNVLYLHGGWKTIVDGLLGVANRLGVRVRVGSPAAALERDDDRATGVRLADGSVIPATAVVIAAPPAAADRLTGTTREAGALVPVRVASLDLGLRRLSDPRALVAFGVDEPLYFSVHSATARLAPEGGALIHASRYLAPGEVAGRETERDLMALVDRLQPGWRQDVVSQQYLPDLVVTNAELLASAAGRRPSAAVDGYSNVFVAGEWVGDQGQLSDAAAASGERAAALAVAAAAPVGAVATVAAGPTHGVRSGAGGAAA